MQALIDACIEEDGKLYLCVSSPTIKDKPVSGNTHTRSLPLRYLNERRYEQRGLVYFIKLQPVCFVYPIGPDPPVEPE